MSFNQDYANETQQLRKNIIKIRKKIAIMSGKGGVGKSTVSANLASYLATKGNKTGMLDIDMHGPSIPKLLKIDNHKLFINNDKYIPIHCNENLKAISVGSLLSSEKDSVIWRGPKKNSVVRQFLKDVEWGELDYMIVDCPPGTGDEQLSLVQSTNDMTGAVIVTTPQDLALLDVKKSISFCKQIKLPILGIIENMSGLYCPDCNRRIDVFKSGGGEKLAIAENIPFLGKISIDPTIVECGDSGDIALDKLCTSHREEIVTIFENLIERSEL